MLEIIVFILIIKLIVVLNTKMGLHLSRTTPFKPVVSNSSKVSEAVTPSIAADSVASAPNSQLNSDLSLVIPYICGYIDDVVQIDSTVEFEVRPSTLDSAFLEGKHMGFFTKKPIPKGTIIMKAMREESKMNDAAVNLEPILQANTSVAMYEAWTNLKKSYYEVDKIKQLVNVRMIVDSRGDPYYETIQDIPADGELLRVYGFTTWILELFDILTNKTVMGFIQFIDELMKEIDGDPYEQKARNLHKALQHYKSIFKHEGKKNIMQLSLQEYDDKMADQKIEYVGNAIKAFYLMG